MHTCTQVTMRGPYNKYNISELAAQQLLCITQDPGRQDGRAEPVTAQAWWVSCGQHNSTAELFCEPNADRHTLIEFYIAGMQACCCSLSCAPQPQQQHLVWVSDWLPLK